jgi:hypothetical protein
MSDIGRNGQNDIDALFFRYTNGILFENADSALRKK